MNIETKFSIGQRVVLNTSNSGEKIVLTIRLMDIFVADEYVSVLCHFVDYDTSHYEEFVSEIPPLAEYELFYNHPDDSSCDYPKIKEIKLVRSLYHIGLKEAKEFVEAKIKIAEIIKTLE